MELLEWADLATLITRSQAQIDTCLIRQTQGPEALRKNRFRMGREEWAGSFSSWLPLGNLAWNWLLLERLLYAKVNKTNVLLASGRILSIAGPSR